MAWWSTAFFAHQRATDHPVFDCLDRRPFVELILATAASLGLAVGSPYPEQMPLQHSATVLLAGWLAWRIRQRAIGVLPLRCLLAFMLLHAFAARWIYSYVPYDAWWQNLSGATVSSYFGFGRNHFDRLVHFCFGVLVFPTVTEIHRRRGRPLAESRFLAVEFVAAVSVLYELFEWGLTFLLSPEDAEGYNGQQGDSWDAHKDMVLAIAGAVLAAGISVVRGKMRPKG